MHPDGKTQVVMISTQHAEPSKATRCKEVASYTGIDAVAPSRYEINDYIVKRFVKRMLAGKEFTWTVKQRSVRVM